MYSTTATRQCKSLEQLSAAPQAACYTGCSLRRRVGAPAIRFPAVMPQSNRECSEHTLCRPRRTLWLAPPRHAWQPGAVRRASHHDAPATPVFCILPQLMLHFISQKKTSPCELRQGGAPCLVLVRLAVSCWRMPAWVAACKRSGIISCGFRGFF